MFIAIVIVIFGLLVLLLIVNFVLTNIQMFQTPFDIVISFPLLGSHTWEGVEFVYIIAGSVLLGVIVIALSTWVLDAKRTLKVRSLRKELKRLEDAVKEMKAALPQEEGSVSEAPSEVETPELVDSSSVSPSPEDITKSFENAVQNSDFYPHREKRDDFDEDQTSKSDSGETEEISEVEKKSFAQAEESAVEAELVDSEELTDEDHSKQKEDKESVDKT